MEGYITRRPRMRRRRLLSIWYAGYSLNRFGMHQFQSSVSLSEDTLVDLLKRAQQDSDPSAFEGLYQLFANRIFRSVLTRVGNRELAEEITHQVFVRLIEKIGMYRIAPANNVPIFIAWLNQVARNMTTDTLRSGKRMQHTALDDAIAIPVSSSNGAIDEEMEFDEVLQKLNNLSDDQHEVITLRFLEDLSIAETAQVMQRSEGAIKALQHRALENLRRQLTQ
jgi:RNA polymerase sigma-70 factor (ECF subfamily)